MSTIYYAKDDLYLATYLRNVGYITLTLDMEGSAVSHDITKEDALRLASSLLEAVVDMEGAK